MEEEAALWFGIAMGGRRYTARASRPPLGGVARVGIGRLRGSLEECGWRLVEEEDGGGLKAREALAVMGGCSCTTIPAIRPARDGVAGHGSGLLRTAERRCRRRWSRGVVGGRGAVDRWKGAAASGREGGLEGEGLGKGEGRREGGGDRMTKRQRLGQPSAEQAEQRRAASGASRKAGRASSAREIITQRRVGTGRPITLAPRATTSRKLGKPC